ncbi:MAG: hypothetical protein CML20_14385 [Rheinheimera sp.]|nr:hypothetical protein [Rheinheimera sp.]|tara:strand:+ start:6527 stop:6883 length:357 start_codon:yes stop_codon:yes gene_type:complete
MNNRRRLIEQLEVTGNPTVNTIEIELYYNAGGMNYFNYKVEKRGYYVSVTPYKISQDGHFKTKEYSAFSGIKTLVEEASRFGKKKLDSITIDPDTRERLLAHVVQNSGLEIKELAKAA